MGVSANLRLSVLAGASVLVATSLAAIGGPPAAAAATFTVDTTTDSTDATPADGVCADAGGRCSLRAAVMQANAIGGADTIILPAGTYTLALPGAGEALSATGDLDITDHLTITGAGAGATIIDAQGIDRVLHIPSPVAVTMNGITITGGTSSGPGGGLVIRPGATVAITNAVISGNTAISQGGGIFAARSTVTLTRTTVRDNSARNGGGLKSSSAAVFLDRVTVGPNNTAEFFGGGLHVFGGEATFRNGTVITGNAAHEDGGGIRVTSTVTVSDSVISGNVADSDLDDMGDGGGVHVGGGTMTVSNSSIGEATVATTGEASTSRPGW